MKIVGVDIGGTKIEAALVQGEQIINTFSCPTPANQSKETVINTVVSAIEKVISRDIKGIGIGVPGLIDLDTNEVIDTFNIPSWDRVPLKQVLEKRFQKPVFVNNDANCFAVGEKHFGKGQTFTNFVGITIGTGFGTGIIINNRLYSGRFCGAGEFGVMPYLDKTIEAYASGQFFIDRGLDGSTLAELASEGDSEVLAFFDEFGQHIGRAISYILFALAPEAVILGGSVSRSFRFFEKGMRNVLENEFPYHSIYKSLGIETSSLKNSAVLGASSLVLDAIKGM